MIGKIGKPGQDFLGVLTYCKYNSAVRNNEAVNVRGELIYHQHINALLFGDRVPLDIIADELKSVAALNSRTRKPVCHVSLSFPPGEKPDHETLQNIAADLMAPADVCLAGFDLVLLDTALAQFEFEHIACYIVRRQRLVDELALRGASG